MIHVFGCTVATCLLTNNRNTEVIYSRIRGRTYVNRLVEIGKAREIIIPTLTQFLQVSLNEASVLTGP